MDYSKITDSLFIGTTPTPEDYQTLHALGIEPVINMRAERRPHADPHNPPIEHLWLRTHDSPFFPIPIHRLEQGVDAALPVIERGGCVYVHCAAGRHRGAAMGAAILIALGSTPEEAMRLIKAQRPIADPKIWYIRSRIRRFAKYWNQ